MTQSTWFRRVLAGWSRLIALGLMVWATTLAPSMVPAVRAEGTRDLLTNGGKRALTEFRDTKTAGLYRRTWLRVYAKAGETINMGSSGMGVGLGDIWLWNPNLIVDSQMTTASIPTPTQKCTTAQSTKGKLTTRAQELAGPGTTGGGYDPCTYTAPEAGVYWVAMLGPAGINGTTDGTAGDILTPNVTTVQNAGVSMWDITVRDSGGVIKPGRVFVDYLAMLAGGNGTTYQQFSTLYATSADGFKYRIDLRGLDPNGYILYGNSVGFLDPDGKTPLYHDLVATDNTLGTILGGVKQSPATAKLFFSAPNADLPTTIVPTPQIPSIANVTFSGSAGGSTASYSVGGQFTYTGNVGGIAEVVISRNGTDFDPTNPSNRVLRSTTAFGTSVINWDGKDNSGTPFPVGGPYSYKASMHAGEYHFPLLDAENSVNGGPTLTLLNPIGGTCPYASCSTAFYDDRAYTTSTGVTVNPSADLTNGKVPPNPLYANPTTGFDSSTNQRKWGDSSSSGFGNWKGLDLWTYFPSTAVQNTLTVVAQQNQDARIQKSHGGAFVIGSPASYTLRVSNVGSGIINNTVTVNDTLPAGLTYVSATGTGWSCSAAGQVVTCTNPNAAGLATTLYLPDITVTVAVGSAAAPSVTNTVTVAIVSADQNPANNTASDPTVIDSADLAIIKSVSPATVTTTGQQVTYTIVLTNNGPSAATGVQVNEAIPAGLTYSSFTASQGTFTTATGVWAVGSMPAGSNATLSIVTTVNSITCGATINNTASRSAGSPYDYSASNDSASAGLLLGGTVSLSGVMTEAGTGVPIVGAAVQLTDSQSHIYNTTTGSGGVYSFTSTQAAPISQGSATVVIAKDGYATSTRTPNIATCGPNTLDVALGTTNLLVTKDDGKQTAAANDVLIYAIKVQNTGTIAAANVVIVDTYPNNLLKFNSDTSGAISGLTVVETINGSLTTRTYTYSPSLAAGASLEFTLQMQVLTPLPAGTTSVWNLATASTTSPEADVTNNEKQDTDAVASAPNLKISKTDGVTTVQGGQTNLVYTLSYRNDGNVAATGVTVVDTLDADVTFVSCPDSCSYNATNHTVTWTIGDVAMGDAGAGTRSVNVTVKSTTAPGAVIGNKAAISGNGTDSDLSNNTAYDSDVVARPEIVLEKTATSAAMPPSWGDQVTYRLTYTNRSSVDATNVVITDPLPAGTTFVSATSPCTHSSGTVTCSLGTLAAGATGSVDLVVTVQEQTSGAAMTGATLTAETAAGSAVTTSATTNAGLKALWTNLDPTAAEGWNANPRAVTFADGSWIGPIVQGFGETHWTDAGRIDAQWVATTTAGQDHGNYTFFRQKFCLPLNATGLSGTLEVANDDYGDQYVNQVGFGTKIGAGEIQSYQIGSGLQAGGNLYAVRLLNNTHGGHSIYEFKDHPGLAFRITAGYAGLAPFAAGPATALAGTTLTIAADPALLGGVGTFEYMIDYGDGTAPTAFGTDASFTHAYAAAGTVDAVVTARDATGCTATDTVPITVLPAGRNLLANAATVGYQNGYGVNYSSAAAAGIPLLSRVDLGIAKTSSPNPAYVGEPIVYTLHVTNNGAHSIGQVSLVDAMPAGVVGASFSASKGAYDVDTHTWTGELGANDSFDLTISGVVDPQATGTLNNTATVAPIGGSDANSTNDSDGDSNTLLYRADLGVSITADKIQYLPGQPLTYVVVVTNNGSSALTSYDLDVLLPAGFTVSTYTAEAGAYDPATGAWTGIQFGSVETLTLTITGMVVAGTTGTLVANATVSTPAGVTDGVAANNTASVSTPVNPLGVTLAEFSAVQQGSFVLLTWETNSELNNRGFNLYRGTSDAGPDRQLNETLIPSQSQGNPGGFIYTWEDRADLVHGTTYFYWVEDVDIYGVATMHGPVSVDFTVPTAVTLHSMEASPVAGGTLPLAGAMLALLAPLAGALILRRRA